MNFELFHFIRPYWLLAMVPALLLGFFARRQNLRSGNWADVCDEALLPYILQQTASQQRRWPSILATVTSLIAIIALAGPTWQQLPSPTFRNQSALVILLDLSRSMDATDLKPSRLARARYKIADILKQRKDGQTALVVYAGDAFVVTPLTNDTATIVNQLNALNTAIMPTQGSNPEAALKQAAELLQQAGQQQGDILLISDGIAEHQREAVIQQIGNYSLSVLAVGTAEGAPVPLTGGGLLKNSQGDIVLPRLDTQSLQAVAQAGHGRMISITTDDRDIQTLLTTIDRPTAERSSQSSQDQLIEQWDDKGPWLILLVLPVALLFFRKGAFALVLLVMLPLSRPSQAVDWQSLWSTDNQQAQQAFQQEQYKKAAEQFDTPQWKASAAYRAGDYQQAEALLKPLNDAQSHYNRGNALAKGGQLQPALAAYEQALALNPVDADTLFNKKAVEEALKKQQDQQSKSDDSSQQEKSEQQENSEQSESDSDSSSSDQSSSDQNSEQNPASQPQQNESDEKQDEQTESQQEQQSESEQETEANEQEASQPEKSEQETGEEMDSQAAPAEPLDEAEQANEQWLRRIPDNPAGLLQRKFKYQYNRRNQPPQNGPSW